MFVILLAAGKGSRMNSSLSKVLHTINEQPMILIIVLKLLSIKKIKKILIVVGKNKRQIVNLMKENLSINDFNMIEFVYQQEQLGTGHAVKVCEYYLSNYKEYNSLILFADLPLIKVDTLSEMINSFTSETSCLLGICETDKVNGSGRIIIENGYIIDSIEERDCNEEQLQIKTINSGIYIIKNNLIVEYINKIKNNNSQKEYYLPDIMKILIANNYKITPFYIKHISEILNVNTQNQLKEASQIYNNKVNLNC